MATQETLGVLRAIWATSSGGDEIDDHHKELVSYMAYVVQEKDDLKNPGLLANIPRVIQELKSNPARQRSELKDLGVREISGESLDLSVRLMLATACETPGAGQLDVFRPRWKEDESLQSYVDRVFPRSTRPYQDWTSIHCPKFALSNLVRSPAKLKIVWTNRLTDHLMLLKDDSWKALYIFRHPTFIRRGLDTLRRHDPGLQQTTGQALPLGCLPPALLRETLATLDLLVPVTGHDTSWQILQKEIEDHGLDPALGRLHRPRDDGHEHPLDALDPTSVQRLYQKFPYWGERLYELWKEVDDPTPTTGLGWWSDSRKNPRFAYRCAAVSLALALFFGIAATILGALQVWISYCAWINDPTATQCWHKPAGTAG